MKLIPGVILTLAFASMAMASEESTNTPNMQRALSFRIGAYNETHKYEDWKAKYSAPFVGAQLYGEKPLGPKLSFDYLGALDLAYGKYNEPYNDDFDQSLTRLKLQTALAYSIPMGRFVVSPLAGIGLRYWHRGDGDGVSPYIETWQAFYAVFGIRAYMKTATGVLFAQIDAQVSLSEKISTGSTLGFDYDFKDEDRTDMVTLEFGHITGNKSLSLFLESFTYSKESPNPQPTLGLGLGEEISATTFGARFGVAF